MQELPVTEAGALDRLKADIAHFARVQNAPVTAGFLVKLFCLTPGFGFVFRRRLSEAAVAVPVVGRLLRRWIWARTSVRYGSELAISTYIGGGLYVPHPYGIVVGHGRIGRNVTLLQDVTIGNLKGVDGQGAIISDGCYIGAGARILGDITLGEQAVIGANSVVRIDVPAGAVAAGVPATVRVKGTP
jgi:serine O-acetyltransferase